MNTISVMVLIISGYIFQFEFFLKNDFGTFFFVFILFGVSMVPAAFFISTLVKKSQNASIFKTFICFVFIFLNLSYLRWDLLFFLWELSCKVLYHWLSQKALPSFGEFYFHSYHFHCWLRECMTWVKLPNQGKMVLFYK